MAMRMKRGLVPLAALAVVAGSMVVAPSTAWAAGGIDNEEAMGQKGWTKPASSAVTNAPDGTSSIVASYDLSYATIKESYTIDGTESDTMNPPTLKPTADTFAKIRQACQTAMNSLSVGQGGECSGVKRVMTVTFDKPVLDPFFVLGGTPGGIRVPTGGATAEYSGSKGAKSQWWNLLWDNIRVSEIDGKNPAERTANLIVEPSEQFAASYDSRGLNFALKTDKFMEITPEQRQAYINGGTVPANAQNIKWMLGWDGANHPAWTDMRQRFQVPGYVSSITFEYQPNVYVAVEAESKTSGVTTLNGYKPFNMVGLAQADISLVKTFDQTEVRPGEELTWSLTVKNTSDKQPLHGYVLKDFIPDLIDPATVSITSQPAGSAVIGGGTSEVTMTNVPAGHAIDPATGYISAQGGTDETAAVPVVLAPGASETWTMKGKTKVEETTAAKTCGAGAAPATITNTAKLLPGIHDPNLANADANNTSVASVNIACDPAEFTFEKTATPSDDDLEIGDTITYTFTVTNTSQWVTLKDYTIKDELEGLSEITCPADKTLAPGASQKCTATYKVTEADAKAEKVVNKATATVVPKGNVPEDPQPKDSEVTTPIDYRGSVVVKYKDTEGNEIKAPVTDEDKVLVGTPYDTSDEGDKPTEIVTDDGAKYVLVPSKTEGAENGSVVKGDTVVTYVYQKVANWVPMIPGKPLNEDPRLPYPFDPENPDKPIVPGGDQVIPYVPGFTPHDPGTNEPLKPVDPADPNKGYVPPTPDKPGNDTYIPYVQDKLGSVVINYIDTAGNVIQPPVTDENSVSVGTKYDTTDEGDKPTEITTADGTKYVLVPSKTNGAETGEVTEGVTSVTYVYQKVANWIPQIPNVPETEYPKVPYPFDPENPDNPIVPGPNDVIPFIPDFVPVDPKTNEPLKPVDPEDPMKGYVPPTPENPGVDTPIPYVALGSVVVKYTDTEGNEIKAPVTDEDKVPAGTKYDTTDEGDKPTEIVTEDGTKYVLVPSKTTGTENGEVVAGETVVTYVYQKVANWIPQIPGVPETEYPKLPYPFDPENPDKPIVPGGDQVIPFVPGYTPVDPKTNEPLKPVDPTDPKKGYVPPTPENPGVDTPIPYVSNPDTPGGDTPGGNTPGNGTPGTSTPSLKGALAKTGFAGAGLAAVAVAFLAAGAVALGVRRRRR
ncbi:DUF7507 domain-containing protein [Schaalia hyovaginalis]|uniref:DUF7507 domain-containing protein n=1 Tax=Schaalia hyovaginalis TaxID=29316 RepID=UPI0018A6BA31|nr:MucBP domain-containing protein [Schaalia hyovaginalis]